MQPSNGGNANDPGLLQSVVVISLDGREYRLRYRAYAFIRYSEDLNRDLLNDIRDLQPVLTELQEGTAQVGTIFSRLRDVLWAGLIDLQPEVTRDALARMMDLSVLEPLMMATLEALAKGMPKPRPTAAATMPPEAIVPVTPQPIGNGFGSISELPMESQSVSFVP